ncbi:hypothetical protein C8R44DRAFT_243995 [Mycena epipterygia]|nr:hypothetical protein C8R44DRAFT_243995 [Mycena epipterygia]
MLGVSRQTMIILAQILSLNPLRGGYSNLSSESFTEDQIKKVLDRLRSTVLKTIDEPLDSVCDKLPAAPYLHIKILILRRYARKHQLHTQDGRGQRSFWHNIDMFYRAKVDALGESFDMPAWQLYLAVTFRKDTKHAPPVAPVIPVVLEKPLFTWQPLLTTRRCDSEEGEDEVQKNRYVEPLHYDRLKISALLN